MRRRDFTDLEVWKKGKELRSCIYQLTQKFPKEEKNRLTDQIVRSSRSVTANIAEGYGRYHYQENIQFLRIARGSLMETKDHLLVANGIGALSQVEFEKCVGLVDDNEGLLNGYINYLKRKRA